MNAIETIEKEQIAQLAALNKIPEFGDGDTIKVLVRVREGERIFKQQRAAR